MNYTMTNDAAVNQDDLDKVQAAYDQYTKDQIGEDQWHDIAFFVHDDNGHAVAGVKGSYGVCGWLWLDLLFVSDELRGKGYGRQLMEKMESEAKKRGCHAIYLNSFSFQGASFYQKLGYQIYGELKDFPQGHCVVSLMKKLNAE